MLFTVMGVFKADIDTAPRGLQPEMNEHLGQQNVRILSAGELRDKGGKRSGFFGIIEADSFERAESYFQQSPYNLADLYERTEVAQFLPELGQLK